MNKRKEIEAVLNELADLRSRIEIIQQDEQEAYDAMPEGLKNTERGMACENAASRLEDALTACDEIEEALNEATD